VRPELQTSQSGGARPHPAGAAATGLPSLEPRPPASPVARPRSAATGDATTTVNRSQPSSSDSAAVASPRAGREPIRERAIATMPAPPLRAPSAAAPAPLRGRAAVVQRAESEPPSAPLERPTDYELDQLADRLYGRISARLRGELRIDRERAGLATDVR
jgi:hypothetical protein